MLGALLLASAVTVAALDQLTKALVARTAGGRSFVVAGVGIRERTNARGGLLPLSRRGALLAWVVVCACLVPTVALGPPLTAPLSLGVGLVVGGAAGNLVDRYTRDGVLDFIVIGPWPAFNVADAALVGGTALVYWSVL